MDQELTVEGVNSRVIAICKNGKGITEDSGLGVEFWTSLEDFTGDFYSHFRLADYVWIFSTKEGLTLNYMPVHADDSKDDWQYDIDISQVESFTMPPKARYENSPATDQSIQG